MRALTVAAVQVAPSHGPLSAESIAANCEHAASWCATASRRPELNWWCCPSR